MVAGIWVAFFPKSASNNRCTNRLPETLIGSNKKFWLDFLFERWTAVEGAITEEAYAEYLRCWEAEGAVEASCADYRAVERDLEHDAEDRAAGRLIECPVLTLWATEMAKRKGKPPRYRCRLGCILLKMAAISMLAGWQTGQSLDHMTVWRERASDVRGWGVEGSGHFIPEETPEVLVEALTEFVEGVEAGAESLPNLLSAMDG